MTVIKADINIVFTTGETKDFTLILPFNKKYTEYENLAISKKMLLSMLETGKSIYVSSDNDNDTLLNLDKVLYMQIKKSQVGSIQEDEFKDTLFN